MNFNVFLSSQKVYEICKMKVDDKVKIREEIDDDIKVREDVEVDINMIIHLLAYKVIYFDGLEEQLNIIKLMTKEYNKVSSVDDFTAPIKMYELAERARTIQEVCYKTKKVIREMELLGYR